MFASFKGGIGVHRGTGILAADHPGGHIPRIVMERLLQQIGNAWMARFMRINMDNAG